MNAKFYVKYMSYFKDDPSGVAGECGFLPYESEELAIQGLNDLIRDEWTTTVPADNDDGEALLADVPGYGEEDGKYASCHYSSDRRLAWDDNGIRYYRAEVVDA